MMLKKHFIIYTFVFSLVFCLGFFPFIRSNISFIYYIDGVGQYYPVFLYIGKYLRSVFDIRQLNIPIYDLAIGMGEDIIGCLNYYGFGDPLNFIAIFANNNNGEYIFCARYLIGLFIAGLSFCFYCKKVHINEYAGILGSIIYVFSGFTLCGVLRYMEWISVLFYFPMILSGIEDYIHKKKKWLLIISVAYGSMCGFYYLYMVSVTLVVYCIIRLLFFTRSMIKTLEICLQCLLTYILGICISLPCLMPSIKSFLNSERNADVMAIIKDTQLYKFDFNRIKLFFWDSIMPTSNRSYALGILLIEWIIIALYLLTQKGLKILQLRIALCLSLLALAIPITDWFFNGFGQCYDRWRFLIHFLYAVIFSSALSEHEINISNTKEKVDSNPIIKKIVIIFVALIVFANIIYNMRIIFMDENIGLADEFVLNGEVWKYVDSPVNYTSIKDDNDFFRIANDSITDINGRPENVAMLNDYYGLTYWFSVVNKNTQGYVNESNGKILKWRSYGFVHNIFTEALAGGKYYLSKDYRAQEEYVLTEETAYADELWYVYKNPYFLGMVYFINNTAMEYGDFETLEEYNKKIYELCTNNGIENVKYNNSAATLNCKINAKTGNKLVVAIPYSKNWEAYIDGEKVKIEKFNMYISLNPPSGYHSITLIYSNSSFILCFIISILALVGAVYTCFPPHHFRLMEQEKIASM